MQRKIPEFEAILVRTSDPIDRFMKWYSCERPHVSLNHDEREIWRQAFQRKMPSPGAIVVDEQTKGECGVK